ncbi:hypothetical protein B0H11DRAFT_1770261, partial [Mycena galericulata]
MELYNESLSESLNRYHPAYDPITNDDPLLEYGVVDGLLPGKTAEETMAFRDVIIHWSTVHCLYFWVTLPEAIKEFSTIKVSMSELWTYGTEDAEHIPVYSLGNYLLERIGHIVLALTQVLEGIFEFIKRPHRDRFLVDPEWKYLRLMEENYSPSTIILTFATMQFRLTKAMKYAALHLNSIKRVFGLEALDTMSSVDSTRSSVRSDFGRGEPVVELAKLLARPDY